VLAQGFEVGVLDRVRESVQTFIAKASMALLTRR
jgi:hypothetical protein